MRNICSARFIGAVLLAVGCSYLRSARALHCESDGLGYTIKEGEESLFIGQRPAVFVDGQWFASSHEKILSSVSEPATTESELVFKGKLDIKGQDNLGEWSGTQATWQAAKTTFVTKIKNYSGDKLVVFTYSFPEGAGKTASGHNSVISNFPALLVDNQQMQIDLSKVLSWQGSFVSAHRDRTFGSTSGPYVFYSDKAVSSGYVLVASPLDQFMISSQTDVLFDNRSATWVPGASGTVESLPAGFEHAFILYAGHGVTQTVYEWGNLLQEYYNTTRLYDVTLDTLGYQTDNGAMYCFCPRDCDDTLLKMKLYLDSNGVTLGYLSFQGDWWHGSGGAPWCVSEWTTNGRYPMPLETFQKKLGVPLQLYAPYFCNDTKYARDNGGNFTMVTSNTSLPGCKDFLFKDPSPGESRKFYGWLYALGKSFGMVSYEPDFMNQNYNCMPAFISDTTSAEKWMQGMNDAGVAANVTVQWCFATPSNLLQALSLPAVTNFRASFDYYYGGSYNIGLSSLLIWSLGGAPSKDTFWTTDNAPLGPEMGGCDRKRGCPADHNNASCELHTILAIMSTGPVGFSDAIGKTNTSLIMRTCRQDGVLLKPAKAITAVDATLSSTRSPPGDVYSTYDGPSPSTPLVFYILSFNLRESWVFEEADFWPSLPNDVSFYVYRERWNWPLCEDGRPSSSCVSFLKRTAANPIKIELPVRDSANASLTPRLTTVWPVCANGWALLGEMSKYTTLSARRFPSAECTSDGLSFSVAGPEGEEVQVTALQPGTGLKGSPASEARVLHVKIPAGGVANISLP